MSPTRRDELFARALSTPGFLPEDEALALLAIAVTAVERRLGPLVEIGAYLGRSTLVLAAALHGADDVAASTLLSVDHHRGSEEMQVGWAAHDPALVDPASGRMDTLGRWRATLAEAGLEGCVIGLVGDSALAGRELALSAGLVFIDGGHGEATCWGDYLAWRERVVPGGFLVFHDVFEDPLDGGRPPFDCYRDALGTGRFVEPPGTRCRSLAILERRD